MASSTRRRRRTPNTGRATDNQSAEVQVSFPRAFVNRVANWFRERDEIAALVGARIAATALSQTSNVQGIARTLGMELNFEGPATPRRRATTAPITTAQQPAAARGRRPSTTRTRRAANANLGQGQSLRDQVYRALPAIGQTANISDIAQQCRLPNGRKPRNQDVGGVLNRFQRDGIVNKNGNLVSTLRLAA